MTRLSVRAPGSISGFISDFIFCFIAGFIFGLIFGPIYGLIFGPIFGLINRFLLHVLHMFNQIKRSHPIPLL